MLEGVAAKQDARLRGPGARAAFGGRVVAQHQHIEIAKGQSFATGLGAFDVGDEAVEALELSGGWLDGTGAHLVVWIQRKVIGGKVVHLMPAIVRVHGQPSGRVSGFLGQHVVYKKGDLNRSWVHELYLGLNWMRSSGAHGWRNRSSRWMNLGSSV